MTTLNTVFKQKSNTMLNNSSNTDQTNDRRKAVFFALSFILFKKS